MEYSFDEEKFDKERRERNRQILVLRQEKLDKRSLPLGLGLWFPVVGGFAAWLFTGYGLPWDYWLPENVANAIFAIVFIVGISSWMGIIGTMIDKAILDKTYPGDEVPFTPWRVMFLLLSIVPCVYLWQTWV